MKKLKTIGIILLLLLVTGGLYISQAFLRFDLMLNPINRHVHLATQGIGFGKRISLVPELFSPGMPMSEVEKGLLNAGFERRRRDQVWQPYRIEIDSGRRVYRREADAIPCNMVLYVFATFNEEGGISKGEAVRHERGCL